jgi:hypothetical protein
VFALRLNCESGLGDLAKTAALLTRRPYPNLVFYLSLEADEEQVQFLTNFGRDLDAATGRHTAFLPLIDVIRTGGVDRSKAGTAITASDLAVDSPVSRRNLGCSVQGWRLVLLVDGRSA